MKTILIPTDFSKHAFNAVIYAASLAEQLSAKLILLHTFHVPSSFIEVPAAVMTEQEIEQETDTELKNLVKQVQNIIGTSINIEYINREGLLMDTLQDLVNEKAVDLIVMGTQGVSGWEETIIGSHTANALEKVDCPLLVIPATAAFKKTQKILYATDFQFDDFDCINQVAEIAQAYDAEIIVTHVSTDQENESGEEDLLDWFIEIAESNISYSNVSYKTYTGEKVLEKLNKAIHELGIDILCMSTVRRTFFEKLYHSSLTIKMAYQSEIPLLAFHIPEHNRL